jgi:hypothetical protein
MALHFCTSFCKRRYTQYMMAAHQISYHDAMNARDQYLKRRGRFVCRTLTVFFLVLAVWLLYTGIVVCACAR